jgi:hypothetical protein
MPRNVGRNSADQAAGCADRKMGVHRNGFGLPVVRNHFTARFSDAGRVTIGRRLEIPPLVLRMAAKSAQAHARPKMPVRRPIAAGPARAGGGPGAPGCRGCGWPDRRARASGSPPRSARSAGSAGARSPRRRAAGAHLLEDLLDPRPHDADQFGPRHGAPVVVPVAGLALPISMISRSSMPVAITPPKRVLMRSAVGHGDLQPVGDIGW